MDMVRYLLLGCVQGLTEFLPISSSAHLLLLQNWIGLSEPPPLLVAVLHLGTLLAILVFFQRDIRWLFSALRPNGWEARRYLGLLIVGLIPIIVLALIFRSTLTGIFSFPRVAAGLLLVNSLLLFFSDRLKDGRKSFPSLPSAFFIGLGQAASVLPGISRSGATVFLGVLSGLTRTGAFRFSFLLGIPTFVGAAIFSGLSAAPENIGGLAVGAISAFIFGLFALWIFRHLFSRRRLWPFALYCLLLGIAGLAGS